MKAANGVVAAPLSTSVQAEGSKLADPVFLKKVVDAGKLVRNIRTYGHLAVENDPLGIGTIPDRDCSSQKHLI